MSDFTATRTAKASRRYKCDHCRGSIASGKLYVRISGSHEGDFFALKVHVNCEIIRRDLVKACGIEHQDEMLELPDELQESLHRPGVLDIARRYNAYAQSVGGALVDLTDCEPAQDQPASAGPAA